MQIYSLINVRVKTGGSVYPERGIWCGTHPLHNQQKCLPHVLKVKNKISIIKEILDFYTLCTNNCIPLESLNILPDRILERPFKAHLSFPCWTSKCLIFPVWPARGPFPLCWPQGSVGGGLQTEMKTFFCVELQVSSEIKAQPKSWGSCFWRISLGLEPGTQHLRPL